MKKTMAYFFVVGLLALSISVMGCDDSDDSGGGDTPCEQMFYEICTEACDCADDCAYRGDGMSSSSNGFDACYEMDVMFQCEGGLDMDFDACKNALGDGECDSSGSNTFFQLPEACNDI